MPRTVLPSLSVTTTDYPPNAAAHPPDITRFEISAEELVRVRKKGAALGSRLDYAFFMNWYAYQDNVRLRGKQPRLLQVLSLCSIRLIE